MLLPKSYKNYQFLWKDKYVGMLWAESVTAERYFLKEGILVYDDPILTAYGSPDEMKSAAQYGLLLFQDPKKTEELFADLRKLKKHFRDLKKYLRSKDFSKASNKELLSDYKKVIQSFRFFVGIYHTPNNIFRHLLKKYYAIISLSLRLVQKSRRKYFQHCFMLVLKEKINGGPMS